MMNTAKSLISYARLWLIINFSLAEETKEKKK